MTPEADFREGLLLRELRLGLAGVFALLIFPGVLSAQYEHQDLKNGKKVIKKLLVLPPEANLVKSGMKGAEPLPAESHTMEIGLSAEVAQTLSEKGFTVLPDAFSEDVLAQHSDLKYEISDLQARYDKLRILIQKKPKDVRTGRFTLGDEVADLAPGADADALVFVRAEGVVPTTGLKTFVVVTGMGFTRNYARLAISIVDAQTGTVLYFTKPNVFGNFIADPDSMKVRIYNSFSDFKFRYSAKN